MYHTLHNKSLNPWPTVTRFVKQFSLVPLHKNINFLQQQATLAVHLILL
jgi:hypothetical protein